jgi:histidine triad (HIT) family protein
MTDPNCIFCQIVAGSVPATFVHQDDEIVAFRDIHPGAPTHILIIPRQHLVSLDEASAENAPLMGRLVATAAQIARDEGIAATGYRLVTNIGVEGGQSVFHLHWHLLGGRRLSWPPG